ncbi:MAG TPA: hypothetical protein P5076_19650, partial [Myxococcota bacterium]|nr:hypothetical protein [Myxococcota bacterium]
EGQDGGAFGMTLAPPEVAPGGLVELEVAFAPPDDRRFEALLVLLSNDPDQARAEVRLGGDGFRSGALEVEPREVDFGLVAAGQVGLGQVTLRNAGDGELLVLGIELGQDTHPDYQIMTSTRTPADLAGGAEVRLNLAYRPDGDSQPPGLGRLVVRAADPRNPRVEVLLRAGLNRAPLADAGADQQVAPLSEVSLDGSASSDPDGDLPLTFAWSLARAPEGSSAALLDADLPVARLVPDLVGLYEAELWVTDATGLRSLLPDRAAITALPAERLLVELVWDSPLGDLDLHLISPGGAFGGLLDCFYANPAPDWGVSGDSADDPRLLRDDLAGFGPETIGYAAPIDGSYVVSAHYFAAHTPSGSEPTTATLRVFVDGLLAAEVTRRLQSQGETWEAVRVQWPEGVVSPLDGGAP